MDIYMDKLGYLWISFGYLVFGIIFLDMSSFFVILRGELPDESGTHLLVGMKYRPRPKKNLLLI